MLPVAPEPAEVAGVLLPAAARELSLAWKPMWLVGDLYPQGKDLYDAVLLAERHRLPNALLQEVFRQAGEALSRTGTWSSSTSRTSPGEEVFPARLVEALRPTFPDAA